MREVNGVVALRKESVDRNITSRQLPATKPPVALRKESVDRNRSSIKRAIGGIVALRKESVDRNRVWLICLLRGIVSLSARRAWIEIWQSSSQLNVVISRSPQGERG